MTKHFFCRGRHSVGLTQLSYFDSAGLSNIANSRASWERYARRREDMPSVSVISRARKAVQ